MGGTGPRKHRARLRLRGVGGHLRAHGLAQLHGRRRPAGGADPPARRVGAADLAHHRVVALHDVPRILVGGGGGSGDGRGEQQRQRHGPKLGGCSAALRCGRAVHESGAEHDGLGL